MSRPRCRSRSSRSAARGFIPGREFSFVGTADRDHHELSAVSNVLVVPPDCLSMNLATASFWCGLS
jgi:hypothetical protein